MIKLFRNHVYLCTFTTAILSLLQAGAWVNANACKPKGCNITVTPITVTPVPPPSFPLNVSPHSLSENISRRSVGSDGHLERLESDASRSNLGYPLNREERTPLGGNRDQRKPLSGMSGEREPVSREYSIHGHDGKLQLVVHDGLYYLCSGCKNRNIDNHSYKITNENVETYPSNFAIKVHGHGAKVSGKNVTISSEIPAKPFTYGVKVLDNGNISLTNLMLKNASIGLYANNGIIEVKKGIIENNNKAVKAIEKSLVILGNTKIKTDNGNASLWSYGDAKILMKEGEVNFTNSHGVYTAQGGEVNLSNVTVTGKGDKDKKHAVFFMDLGGSVNFNGIVDVTDGHAILLENTISTFNSVPLGGNLPRDSKVTEVNVKSSSITVNGDKSYGIYFRGEAPFGGYQGRENLGEEKIPSRIEAVNIRKTTLAVPDSTAIYSTDATFGVVNLMQSTLSGKALLRVEKGALVKVLASASTLEGGAYVDDVSTSELYLGDGATWILKQNQHRNLNAPGSRNESFVSLVSLIKDSSINFKKQKSSSNYEYQTLHIGKGTGEVYKVSDGAHIYLNTYLNTGGSPDKQETDRILIHGDVSGISTVHVRPVSGSPGGYTGKGGNSQGISIIQVSGKAEKNSFKLDGGYVTLEHSPYRYQLYAYGPESDLGEADISQRVVKGDKKFWDFRLENRYIDSDIKPGPVPDLIPIPHPHPEPAPKPEVKDVVPQVSTYLLLPNVLFHTGLMNVGNHNKRLEILRNTSEGVLSNNENSAFFVRGYGGNHHYSSNLSTSEYGYGGDLDYNAIDAGVLLQTIENLYSTVSFGIIGSYEKLSLQPLDVEQSRKSAFNKWSVTAYGGMQHDSGFYVDGLLSYGLFKGDVLTRARGKTAALKGNPLSVSLNSGKAFIIGDDAFVFDPQVQVVYQRLYFDKAHDIDDFDIDMGKLDQWVMRVGGRLTKTLTAIDEARLVSLYGKLHLIHGFAGKQFVHFKDAFQLGALGSALETGLGFNARLSPKFELHADLVYQHKLTKAGFSGTSFSGGLRYRF
ncbi:autotransporter family protein [Bartonella sp. CB169]|uniref:autotransporter family protein n=1 Tax=Bartonella sp. CB169 TaxID=3112257 RepID=UPI00300DD4AD